MARGPVGQITRGTTGTNRLRRVDRWIARQPSLRRASDPLVVDLGYGASGVTALELHSRLARVRPDVEVLGLEIDPAQILPDGSQGEQYLITALRPLAVDLLTATGMPSAEARALLPRV